jgi:hypothetical protein
LGTIALSTNIWATDRGQRKESDRSVLFKTVNWLRTRYTQLIPKKVDNFDDLEQKYQSYPQSLKN